MAFFLFKPIFPHFVRVGPTVGFPSNTFTETLVGCDYWIMGTISTHVMPFVVPGFFPDKPEGPTESDSI